MDDTIAATNAATVSTIVKRDVNGDFSAVDITATTFTGDGSALTNLPNSAGFSGNLAGDVTGPQGTTVVALVGGETAADVSTSVTATQAATNLGTFSTIVARDGSGDFTANMITSDLTGDVTGNADTATSATSFTGNLVGDVTGPQGTTVVATVGGETAADVSTSVTATQAATNAMTVSTLVKRDGSGNFIANQIDADSALRFKDNDGGDHYATLKAAAAMAGDVTYTFQGVPKPPKHTERPLWFQYFDQ